MSNIINRFFTSGPWLTREHVFCSFRHFSAATRPSTSAADAAAARAAEELKEPLVFGKYPKLVKYGTFSFSTALSFWIVFKVDFGENEHCFSGIRRWTDDMIEEYWAPSSKEAESVRRIEKELQINNREKSR